MSKCIEKRFENLIHAYEMGMLTSKQRREVELHLMVCQCCMNSVLKFEEFTNHLDHDESVRKQIKELSLASESAYKSESTSTGKETLSRGTWKRVIPVFLVIAIILFLLFKPWTLEFQPTKEAKASDNSLVVLYIKNIAEPDDPENLGKIAMNLLISDLAESQYLQVVSTQHLSEILTQIGKKDSEAIGEELAAEVAKKANSRWMLTGNILQTEPQIIISVQIVDAESGHILSSRKIEGSIDDDIFKLVDKLTAVIKNDLPLLPDAINEPDPQIASITTNSQKAYFYYLEGQEYLSKFYYGDAFYSFNKALEYDSTLAQAYYFLSTLTAEPEYIEKAVQYIDNVCQVEKHYIWASRAVLIGDESQAVTEYEKLIKRYPNEKMAYYYYGLLRHRMEQYENAIIQFKEAIALDPYYKLAINNLAYSYDLSGNPDSAFAVIDRYIALYPDEANPYDSKAELSAKNGLLDEAIKSYRKALEIKSNFPNSILGLGDVYLLKRDYAMAEESYREYISKIGGRVAGRLRLTYILVAQGRYENALNMLDDGIAADRLELSKPTLYADYNAKFLLKAALYAELSQYEKAIIEIEHYRNQHQIEQSDTNFDYFDIYAWLLAKNNQVTKAKEVAENLKKVCQDSPSQFMHPYWWTLGYIELAQDNSELACTYFEKLSPSIKNFDVQFMRARAYLKSGKLDKAINLFEELELTYTSPRIFWSNWAVMIHYYLGLAYEETGRINDAISHYETFLDIWKNADSNIPLLDDARERMNRLKDIS
ncbi:MAG: FlgO family outer membrane protein [candidate division Zixibacteria bacterium]